MITPTHFNLYPEHFQRGETPIVQSGTLSASTFRFASGVCAVRLRSDRAEVVILPFQGQHIWSAVVDGRNLGWRSMVTEPVANVPFLATFGGFMQHCGISGVGGPSADVLIGCRAQVGLALGRTRRQAQLDPGQAGPY